MSSDSLLRFLTAGYYEYSFSWEAQETDCAEIPISLSHFWLCWVKFALV